MGVLNPRSIAFILAITGGALLASAQPLPWAGIDASAQNYIKKAKNAGLVVGIIRGEAAAVRGYGVHSRENQQVPDGTTVFEIGGLSCVFTTTAAILAARDFGFELADPIQPYLNTHVPVFKPQRCMEITLPTRERIVSCSEDPLAEDICIAFCDLADHTAGLSCSCEGGYGWNPFVDIRYEEEAFADLSKQALYISLNDFVLESAPGSAFRYSNFGIALLGHLVSDIGGLSYGQLLERYLTGPLDMPDTRLKLDANQAQRLATGHNYRGRPIPPWTFEAMAPAAGLRSTADDLLRFLRANLRDSRGPRAFAYEEARQPRLDVTFPGWKRPTSAGYGWLVSLLSRESNLPVAWINGGTGGYRAWMGLNTDTQTAVVVLANCALPVDEVGWEVMGLVAGH